MEGWWRYDAELLRIGEEVQQTAVKRLQAAKQKRREEVVQKAAAVKLRQEAEARAKKEVEEKTLKEAEEKVRKEAAEKAQAEAVAEGSPQAEVLTPRSRAEHCRGSLPLIWREIAKPRRRGAIDSRLPSDPHFETSLPKVYCKSFAVGFR